MFKVARLGQRLRAVVANTLGVDIPGALSDGAPRPVSMTPRFFLESAKDAFGTQSDSEFLKGWSRTPFGACKGRSRCRCSVMITEDEIAEVPKTLVHDTFEFLAGLTGPVSFRVFTREEGASGHCQLCPALAPRRLLTG